MKKILFLILLLVNFSFSNEIAQKNINDFKALITKLIDNRYFAIDTYEEANEHKPLRGKDLDNIHHMLLNYIATKDKLEYYINRYKNLATDNNNYNSQNLTLVMISLAADLIRYDNYLLSYKNFIDSNRLRRLVNKADKGYNLKANILYEISKSYNSKKNRDDLEKMIKFYKKHIKNASNNNEFFFYLKNIIENSISYQNLINNIDLLQSNINTIEKKSLDTGSNIRHKILNETSKGFGNTVGIVETRKGKFYNKEDVILNIKANIKAGDLLLEKTPFRLTDKLIPGYWGHAAVYIGTKEELIELGLWENPIVKKYHKEIEQGKVIAEALRDDVQLNTIKHFLNIDDLAILHNDYESYEEKRERIILTLRQIGKKYDFEFDVETSDKIFCAELVYASYFSINWKTKNNAGTYTTTPDDIAYESIKDSTPFDITILYHDGKEVKYNKKEYMKQLLEKK